MTNSTCSSNTATAFSLPPKKPTATSTASLSQRYKEIASKAVELGAQWPDSTNANILFDRDDDSGAYLIPSFPEQDAPLAVVAILDRHQGARQIVKECDHIFASFVQDLCKTLIADTDVDHQNDQNRDDGSLLSEELERYTWRIPSGSHHITVAVLQEHPRLLLEQDDKRKWRRVEEGVAMAVYRRISSYQENNAELSSPRLQLDSILLTPDGAMIAGFVDMTDIPTFQQIRCSILKMASSIMDRDSGTSRPKNLIHVTIGRVLALPKELGPAQRQGVASLIHDYNTAILPAKVARMQESSSLPQGEGASFALTELTMIRDVVWTLRKIKEYGSWHLVP